MLAWNFFKFFCNDTDIKDLKRVRQTASLAELGMDSMIAVEIKQTLERDFDIFLSAQEIRVLNIAKLVEMSGKNIKNKEPVKLLNIETEKLTGMKLFIKSLNVSILQNQYFIELPIKCGEKKNEIFFISGLEGSHITFSSLIPMLKVPATCLQLGIHDVANSIEEMAECLLPVCFNNYIKKKKEEEISG